MGAGRAFKLFGLIIGVILVLQFSGLFESVLDQTYNLGDKGDPTLMHIIYIGVFVWLALYAILLMAPFLDKLGDNKENFSLVLSLILAGISIRAPNFVFNVWTAATLGFGVVGVVLVLAAILLPIFLIWWAGNKAIDAANSLGASSAKAAATSAELGKKALETMKKGGDKVGHAVDLLMQNPQKAVRELRAHVRPFMNKQKNGVNDYLEILSRITGDMPDHAILQRIRVGFFRRDYRTYLEELHRIITEVYQTCHSNGFHEENWLRDQQAELVGGQIGRTLTPQARRAFEQDLQTATTHLTNVKGTIIGFLRNADMQLYNALRLYTGRGQDNVEEATRRIEAVKTELGQIPDMIDADFRAYSNAVSKIQKDVEDADREMAEFRRDSQSFDDLTTALGNCRVTNPGRYVTTGVTDVEPVVDQFDNAFARTTTSMKEALDAVITFIDRYESNARFTYEHHAGALTTLIQDRLNTLTRGVFSNTGVRNFAAAIDAIVANIQGSIATLSADQQAEIMTSVTEGRDEVVTQATEEVNKVREIMAEARNAIARIEADPRSIKAELQDFAERLK